MRSGHVCVWFIVCLISCIFFTSSFGRTEGLCKRENSFVARRVERKRIVAACEFGGYGEIATYV